MAISRQGHAAATLRGRRIFLLAQPLALAQQKLPGASWAHFALWTLLLQLWGHLGPWQCAKS
jgi:hypothetical protein